jgi:hypothetical protein
MKQHLDSLPALVPYNKAVSAAYYNILKGAKAMLATIEQEELRHTLVRDELNHRPINAVINEFINPLLYLRLECDNDGLFVIHYGFEQPGKDKMLSNVTASFTRSIYRPTSKDITEIDIEACVSNSWCIVQCSDLYEYVGEQNKYHQFCLLKYKGAVSKRKQMKAVA